MISLWAAGRGATTLLALQVGLVALWRASGFEQGLYRVIEAGGDTDTNGAVWGAVLGARLGIDGMPRRWRSRVAEIRAGRRPLESYADQLLAACHGSTSRVPLKVPGAPAALPKSRQGVNCRRARLVATSVEDVPRGMQGVTSPYRVRVPLCRARGHGALSSGEQVGLLLRERNPGRSIDLTSARKTPRSSRNNPGVRNRGEPKRA